MPSLPTPVGAGLVFFLKTWTSSFLSGSWVISSLAMAFNVLYSFIPVILRKTLLGTVSNATHRDSITSPNTHLPTGNSMVAKLNLNSTSHCPVCDSVLSHSKGIPKVTTGLPNAVFPDFWYLTHHLSFSYRRMLKNIWLHNQISNQGSWRISLQRTLCAQCGAQTHHTHFGF